MSVSTTGGTTVEVALDEPDGGVVSTVSRPGESWAHAARRAVAGGPDPVAVDLSADIKRFAVDPSVVVSLRPLLHGDLPDVVAWRAAPHVARWWHPVLTDVEAARARYGPSIDGDEPTVTWVVEVNGRSVGLLQDYLVRDHPEFALLVPEPRPGAAVVGVDYLLGRPEWVGRGLGTRVLDAWLRDVVGRRPGVTHAFAAPDHRNHASLRVLAKTGFVAGLWFDEPQADGSVATVVGCTADLAEIVGRRPGEPIADR